MNTENQLAERPQSVKDYLALPAYKARFGEVLGARAPQFMASLIAISSQPNLAGCEPRSVIASAMVAATLDLPIEKSLGFAHVVPYGGVAQFQMAAKGYVQLALRSAQYQRINAKPINAEAFAGYDEVGEPRINWELLDETKPSVGYVVAWKLNNGFTKIAYWAKAKVEAHAAQFSQAYKRKKMDSPWFTNFDKMALKTVVMNELRAWGILSVQMQTALKHDMASQKDVDAEPEYVDGETVDISNDANPQQQSESRPAPPARAKKGAAAVQENTPKPEVKQPPVTVDAEIVPENPVSPTPEAPKGDKTVAPAEEPKTVEKVVPAPTPPAKSGPRDSLNDKEELVALCQIDKVFSLIVNVAGVPTPSVQAVVSGGFTGTVFHFGGASKQGEELVANPEWKVGSTASLSLLGRLNNKTSKMMVVVNKITAEATPENPAMSVE